MKLLVMAGDQPGSAGEPEAWYSRSLLTGKRTMPTAPRALRRALRSTLLRAKSMVPAAVRRKAGVRASKSSEWTAPSAREKEAVASRATE